MLLLLLLARTRTLAALIVRALGLRRVGIPAAPKAAAEGAQTANSILVVVVAATTKRQARRARVPQRRVARVLEAAEDGQRRRRALHGGAAVGEDDELREGVRAQRAAQQRGVAALRQGQ